MKCFFPVENFHFGRPKKFSSFLKVKSKTNKHPNKQQTKNKTKQNNTKNKTKQNKTNKRKQNKTKQKQKNPRSSPHFGTFSISIFNFPPSLYNFSSFLLASFFPGRSAEISRSEVPPCLLRHWAVAEVSQGNNKIYVAFQSILSHIFHTLTNYYCMKGVSL